MNNIEFNDYINNIIKDLKCDKEENQCIHDELMDHLNQLKSEYITKGFNEAESVELAIQSFGNDNDLAININKSSKSKNPLLNIFLNICWYGYNSLIVLMLLIRGSHIFFPLQSYFSQRTIFNHIHNGDLLSFLKFNTNIIPFKQIIEYIVNHGRFNLGIVFSQIVGNILLLLPFGLLLPCISNKKLSFMKIAIYSFSYSLLIESIQLIFNLGIFDIDDIILNTLGGIIGFVLYKTVKKIRIAVNITIKD